MSYKHLKFNEFKIQLAADDPSQSRIEMNGEPLHGVTDLTVRAGANGYTNIICNFTADATVNMTAALIAKVNVEENNYEEYAKYFDIFISKLNEDTDEVFDQHSKGRTFIQVLEKFISEQA